MNKIAITFLSSSLIFSAQASDINPDHPIPINPSRLTPYEVSYATSHSDEATSSSSRTSIASSFEGEAKAAYEAFDAALISIIKYNTKREHFFAEENKDQVSASHARLPDFTNVKTVSETLMQLKKDYLTLCVHPFLAYSTHNNHHILPKLDHSNPDIRETRGYSLSGSKLYIRVTAFGFDSSGGGHQGYVIGDSKEEVDKLWERCESTKNALALENLSLMFNTEFLPTAIPQYDHNFFHIQPNRNVQQWEKLLMKEVKVRRQLEYYKQAQDTSREVKTSAELEGLKSAKEFIIEKQNFIANLNSLNQKATKLYKALQERRINHLAIKYPQIFLSLKQ